MKRALKDPTFAVLAAAWVLALAGFGVYEAREERAYAAAVQVGSLAPRADVERLQEGSRRHLRREQTSLVVIGLFGLIILGGGGYYRRLRLQDLVQSEIRFADSESRLHDLVALMPDGFFIVDADGRNVFVNKALARILGVPDERELIGMRLLEFVVPEEQEALRTEFRAVRRGGEAGEHVEITVVRRDGVRRLLEVRPSPMHSKGALSGVCGVIRDITERRTAEQALRASEERFRSVVDSIRIGVSIIDPSMRIVSHNRQMREWFPEVDLGREAVCHRAYNDPPREETCVYCPVVKTFADGQVHAAVTDTPARGGVRNYRTVASPIRDAEGRIAAVVELVEDVTERKRIDERLQASLREKEVLLRELHHRVKNNLQAITHLLDMRFPVVQDAGMEDFLRRIRGQVRAMALVYQQLYRSDDMSRVEMSSYLQALTSNVLAALGRGDDVALSLEVESASLDMDQAMPCGLLVNELLTNALKHAFPPERRPRGTVRVRFSLEGGRARLRVTDDGVGLPAGFDAEQGATLGLRLVRLWAEHQLGGTFSLTAGDGTTVAVDFPLAGSRRSA